MEICRGDLKWRVTFEEGDEVGFVGGAFGVLPVEIETVEAVFPQERDGAEHKRLPGVARPRHLFEFRRPERPSTFIFHHHFLLVCLLIWSISMAVWFDVM